MKPDPSKYFGNSVHCILVLLQYVILLRYVILLQDVILLQYVILLLHVILLYGVIRTTFSPMRIVQT